MSRSLISCIPYLVPVGFYISAFIGGEQKPDIIRVSPPQYGFYAKGIDFFGIPIKAHESVSDDALFAAYDRLFMMFKKIPNAHWNMRLWGAELHIIGKDQVTSDLPEHRQLKGTAFEGNKTVDERTRGLGGLFTSCGEENLLKREDDRYAGRDICVHEFAHNIRANGLTDEIRELIREQHRRSLAAGLWRNSYAGSNDDEFFSELSMWYFGTHGDLSMAGPKPEDGPDGLKAYDLAAFALIDAIYSGRVNIPRIDVALLKPRPFKTGTNIRSGASNIATTIWFVNRTNEEVRVYWMDYQGSPKPYSTIKPGSKAQQNTNVGHIFVIADKNDNPVMYFAAGTKAGIARIE